MKSLLSAILAVRAVLTIEAIMAKLLMPSKIDNPIFNFFVICSCQTMKAGMVVRQISVTVFDAP